MGYMGFMGYIQFGCLWQGVGKRTRIFTKGWNGSVKGFYPVPLGGYRYLSDFPGHCSNQGLGLWRLCVTHPVPKDREVQSQVVPSGVIKQCSGKHLMNEGSS